MTTPPHLSPTQLDISAENVPAMVRFYDDFFGTGLQPIEAAGTILYRGNLHGLPLLICPNTVAGVDAAQNRHQFSYSTTSLTATTEAAKLVGGRVRNQSDGTATVLDPDGNTIVLVQVI